MEESNNQDRTDGGDTRKMFLGGLNLSTSEEILRKHFSVFGELEDVVVMREPLQNRSRGFAFIRFASEDSVERVLASNSHMIDDRKIEPKRAMARGEIRPNGPNKTSPTSQSSGRGSRKDVSASHNSSGFGGEGRPAPRSGRGSGRSPQYQDGRSPQNSADQDAYAYNKIFVGGLHYETREPDFRAYFERFGTIIAAEVMISRETGKSRGFGFIVFEQESSAVAACEVPDHRIHDKEVEVKRAIPRSKLAPGTPAASIPDGLENQIIQERERFQMQQHQQQQSMMQHEAAVAAFAAGYALPPQLQPIVAGQMMVGPFGLGGGGTQRPRRSPTNYDRMNNANNNNIGSPSSVTNAITPSSTSGSLSVSKAGGPGITARTAPPSYAAALKGAATLGSIEKSASSGNTANSNSDNSSPMAGGAGGTFNSTGGSTLQSLIQSNNLSGSPKSGPPGFDRNSGRSYSEPLEQVGSSALNGEILPPESMGHNGRAGAITKSSSHSNPPSRSNSLALADSKDLTGTPLANLPWLSSPPSNPLMAADGGVDGLNLALPPAALEAQGLSLPAHSMGYSMQQSGHWMDPSQHAHIFGSAAVMQQQAQPQAAHMYGQYGQPQMVYMSAPGNVPYLAQPNQTADMWHHHHLIQQQQTGHLGDATHTAGAGSHYPAQSYMGHFPYFPQQPDLSNLSPQQMMYLSAQQQALQASYQSQMQQLQQYQNQLFQQYGNLQQQAASVHHSPTNAAVAAAAAVAANATARMPGPPPGFGDINKSGIATQVAATPALPPSANDGTEGDDLFRSFNDLQLESAAFNPSQNWVRR